MLLFGAIYDTLLKGIIPLEQFRIKRLAQRYNDARLQLSTGGDQTKCEHRTRNAEVKFNIREPFIRA